MGIITAKEDYGRAIDQRGNFPFAERQRFQVPRCARAHAVMAPSMLHPRMQKQQNKRHADQQSASIDALSIR